MNIKLLSLFIILFLCSCVSIPKKVPVTVSGNNYYDPNIPVVNIDFPFPIRLVEEKIIHSEMQKTSQAKLWSAQEQLYVYINKTKIMTYGYEYTGVDQPSKNLIYESKGNIDNCNVYIGSEGNINFLAGNINDHRSKTQLNNIRLVKKIDDFVLPTSWVANNGNLVESFVEHVKDICEQDLGLRKATSTEEKQTSASYAQIQSKISESQTRYQKGLKAYESQDYATAFANWLLLAGEGHPESAYRIGGMYDFAEGVKQDYKQAAHWYLTAAEFGHGEAQCKIANRYDSGQGVLKNPTEAYKWHWLCSNNKSVHRASKKQAELQMRTYHSVGVLTSKQIRYMENLAEDWEPYETTLDF